MATLKEMALEAENSSRIMKFETLVEDINNVIKKQSMGIFGLMGMRSMARIARMTSGEVETTTPLNMIFSNEELNAFGKAIIKSATIELEGSGDNSYRNPWEDEYLTKRFVDEKIRIKAAKDFIGYCRTENNRPEAYKFIFWALMILSVDDTDADEKLSFICDFARMLRITDEEMMDIVYTIKTIYNEVDKDYEFVTETVPGILGNVFNLYGN